jgi:VanZ family protein
MTILRHIGGKRMLWLTIALLVLLIVSLLRTAVRLRRWKRRADAGAVIGSLAIITALTLAVLLMRLDVPYYLLYLGMLSVWLNGYVGYGLDRFKTSTRFDRVMHAFGAFSFALIAYCVVRSFAPEGGSRLFRAVFVWALGGFLGAAFEVLEYLRDRKKGTRNQHGLYDTDTDLIADLIGGFLAGAFAYFFLLK